MMKLFGGLELAARTLFRCPSKLPRMAQIAITSKCNMACKMCPRKTVNISNKHMPFKTVKEIIDKLEGIERVALVGLGEPFLHPRLYEIIEYCKQRGLYTQTTTNGTLLRNAESIRKAIESGLDSIAFSLESFHDEHSMGHNKKIIVEHMARFITIRNKMQLSRPSVTLQIVLISETMNEIPTLIQWANEVGVDHINISRTNIVHDRTLHRPSRKEEKSFFKKLKVLRQKYPIRIDCVQDQVFLGFMGTLYKCILPFARLESWCLKWSYYTYIMEDGDVVPCSAYFPKEMSLGNIFEESIEKIWNGEKYNALRKSRAKRIPCIGCDNLRLKQRVPISHNTCQDTNWPQI